VQGNINRGRHTDHPAGCHSNRTNHCPPPPSCHIFYRPDALSCCPTNSVKALKATAHSDYREDARVILNGVTCTVSIPSPPQKKYTVLLCILLFYIITVQTVCLFNTVRLKSWGLLFWPTQYSCLASEVEMASFMLRVNSRQKYFTTVSSSTFWFRLLYWILLFAG